MDLLDIFDPEPKKTVDVPAAKALPTEVAKVFGETLPEGILQRAKAAADAHDAEKAVRAAYDNERGRLQQELDHQLATLGEQWQRAKTLRDEAVSALEVAMKAEKITKIPMTDRQDIKTKDIPGKRKQITLTWLKEPEGVVVKTYGMGAPQTIWNAVPKSASRTVIEIPDRYEDEPEG